MRIIENAALCDERSMATIILPRNTVTALARILHDVRYGGYDANGFVTAQVAPNEYTALVDLQRDLFG